MSNILFVFSHTYPYNKPQEQFLNDEIIFASSYFHLVYIIPVSRIKGGKFFSNFPNNVKVISKHRGPKIVDIFIGLTYSFFFIPQFIHDIFRAATTKKSYNLIEALRFYINSSSFYLFNKNLIKDKVNYLEDSVTLYSYWLNSISFIPILYSFSLKRDGYTNVKVIARAHGLGDLIINNDQNYYRPIVDLCNKNYHSIFAISNKGMKHLIKCGISDQLISVSRLGVEKFFDYVSSNSKSNEIITCSVINENKRIIELIKILSKINNLNLIWTHFGGGPLYEYSLSLSKQILPTNIKWTINNYSENSFIKNYYIEKRPCFFINLSKIEGIPVSIMEAFASGIPVIATNTGATDEIVVNNFNGFLVPVDFSYEDIIILTTKLLTMGDVEYSYLSKNAYETWLNKYNSSINYNDFYQNLIKKGNIRYEK